MAFEVEKHNHRHSMRDPEDDTALHRLQWESREMDRRTFRLDWNGYAVPFVVDYDTRTNAPRVDATIISLGVVPLSSLLRQEHPELVDTAFAPGDRERCELRAAEAVVVFGGYYNGLLCTEGKYVVHIPEGPNAGSYTLSSFGYRGAPPAPPVPPSPGRPAPAAPPSPARRRWWERRHHG